jgi:hypothetical protein
MPKFQTEAEFCAAKPNSISYDKLDEFRTEGSRAISDLCRMAEILGYRTRPEQLQCENGAFVSSLLAFFEDNPGVVEAIYDWTREEYGEESDEDPCLRPRDDFD